LRNKNYRIAGKTGTAQIAKGTRGYKIDGVSYQASFTGYFPAENPMYSCIVVVNGPSNNVYYGNVVAGSVFKSISDRLYAVSYLKDNDYAQAKPLLTKTMPYSKGGLKEDVEEVLSELDLDYDDNSSSDYVSAQATNEQIELAPIKVIQNLVPNVHGFGARDAVALLEGMGMRVYLNGIGKVTKQSISPGARIQRGSSITLTLS
jgi:cell division protein FtsI (penicillin-binding protein 3)